MTLIRCKVCEERFPHKLMHRVIVDNTFYVVCKECVGYALKHEYKVFDIE